MNAAASSGLLVLNGSQTRVRTGGQLIKLTELAGLGLEWRKGLTGYQGYHSWDVRLASLGLALLCLLLYYRHGIGKKEK